MKLVNVVKRDKNVLFELSRKNIKTQYRGSFLGVMWTILNPLLTMLVMWLIFDRIFGVGDPYYPIYLLTGNIVFGALRASTTQALGSLYGNRGILLRTKIAPYVFPFSYIVSSVINMLFSFIALIPFMIWLSVSNGVNLFTYRLVFIILMIPALWLFEFGLGITLSILYVFFRDIFHIYNILMILWQYLTPIFYKATRLGDGPASIVVKVNPMFYFVTYFRECIYMGAVGADPIGTTQLVAPYIPQFATLGICYLCGLISFVIGIVFYNIFKEKVLMKV